MKATACAALLCASNLMSGCGTYVPDLVDFSVSPDAEQLKVQTLVDYVACDVKRSIQQVLLTNEDLSPILKANNQPVVDMSWLKAWAAQLTFTLTVEEKTDLNPGVSLTRLYPNVITDFSTVSSVANSVTSAQTFTLGLAGAYSPDATRTETLQLLLPIKDFTDSKSLAAAKSREVDGKLPSCERNLNGQVEADIKFMNWLQDALLGLYTHGGVTDYGADFRAEAALSTSTNVLSHETKFVVIYGGNVNPTWTLAHFAGNSSGLPLFGVTRTNTQDVLITLGNYQGNKYQGALSSAAQATTSAAQIGLAVAAAIRGSNR